MDTRADADETAADHASLRELPDPEFIALWASLRDRLTRTPTGSPGHPEIKSRYDAAKAEFRRRLDGDPATRKDQHPVTHPTTPQSREQAAVTAASATRARCICQEAPDNGPCTCPLPVTREQVGRLRAYAAQHPERAIIMSELAGQWMSALLDSLPPAPDGEDRVLAWMHDPYTLPPAADLQAAADLGELLDTLGAPPAAAMS